MVVQHNMQAMNANRMLNVTTSAQSKSTEKLSSGYKINRAADDAAGLSISEKMRKQIKGLDQASSNAQDGVSAVQTAEGALTEVHSMLQRMNELATQAANGTNSETDRQSIQDEIDQLTTEIDRVAETTKFNETYLLKGNTAGKTSDVKVAAHDAGLAGKLTDNGDGTSTFKLNDALEVGSKIKIGGTEYTIGKSAKAEDYTSIASAKASLASAKTGDSVTSNGVTTSIVDKTTAASAKAATWANNDTFTDADGKEWKVVTTLTSGATDEVLVANAAAKAGKAGTIITKNASLKIGTGASTDVAKSVEVVDKLASNEIDSTAANAATQLQNAAKVGGTISVGGETKEVTQNSPLAFADSDTNASNDITSLVKAATTVSIGATQYTIKTTTNLDDPTTGITADDLLAKIKEGDEVTVASKTYTAIGVSASDSKESNTITVNEAYKKITDELTAASSIGTDKAATVKSVGDGSFTIEQGTVEVKDGLSFNLHVGADADMTNKITVDIDSMSAAGLGVKGLNVKDDTGVAATYAIDAIADAVAKVSAQRSALGAVQNRLEHTIANVDNVVENTTSAESRIRDTDMAEEMVNYSKNNILAQAGQSMLAQANQANQGVLSLLG